LLRKRRKVGGHGEFQDEHGPQVRVGKEYFGDARVNKDSAKNQSSDEHHCASEVEWAGLHHFEVLSFKFSVLSKKL
jgi:hypothetical protein